MPVVASATLEVTPVLSGAQQSLTQQLTGATVEASDKAGQESGGKFASSMAKKIAVGSVAVAGAVTGVGAALVGTASKTAAYGDQIDKASQKLGVSSTFYQEWEAVLQHSGTSMDKMGASFKKLATASQDASADQQAAFAKLGMSMDDVAKMSPEELFTNVISGLQGMENGTERTAVATQLLGKGAMEMGALLNTSAEDTQAMIDTVHNLGGVMSEDAVKASARYQDSLQDMQTAFSGVKNTIGAQLLPVLSDLMDKTAEFVSGTDISAAGDMFMTVFAGIGGAVNLAWTVISTVFSALKDGFTTIQTALGDTEVNWSGAWNSVSSVITQVADTIGSAIRTIAQVIAWLITQTRTEGTIFNKIWAGMQIAVQTARDVIRGVINFISALLTGDWRRAWESARNICSTVLGAIGTLCSSAWNSIRSVASSAWNNIKSAITKPIEDAKDKIKGIIDKIKGFFPISIGKWLSNLPTISLKTTEKTVLGKTITIPTGFEWHAKAMGQPFMFREATLFGAGEAGDEILYGREKLLGDIREATRGNGSYTQNITINSPTPLNPSEIARQTRNQTRSMIMRMRTA